MKDEKEPKVPFSTQLTTEEAELVKTLAKGEGKSISDFVGSVIRAYAAEPPEVKDVEETNRFSFVLPKNKYEYCAVVEAIEDILAPTMNEDDMRKGLTMVIARRHQPYATDPDIVQWRIQRDAQGPLTVKAKSSGENNNRRG